MSRFRILICPILTLSILFGGGASATAADVSIETRTAYERFFQGDTEGAKDILSKGVAASADDVKARQSYLDALLEICSYSEDDDCLDHNLKNYFDANGAIVAEHPELALPLAHRQYFYAGFLYHNRGTHALWQRDILGKFIGTDLETPADVEIYMRRQALEGFMRADLDDRTGALRAADKLLSLIASIKNPQDNRFAIATSLSDAIALLLEVGEIDRAWRVYSVTGNAIAANLPLASVPAMIWRSRQANLLDQMGDIEGARRALDLLIDAATAAHIDADTKLWLLTSGHMRRTVFCVLLGDDSCVQRSLDAHPYAKAAEAPTPANNPAMLEYLAVRTFARAIKGAKPDEALVEALQKTPEFPELSQRDASVDKVLQREAIALATGKPELRRESMATAGRQLAELFRNRAPATPGAWYRISATEKIMLQLALMASRAPPAPDDALSFRLLQLLGRKGDLNDADNLAAILAARDADDRRTIHQALRLNAKRNQLELRQLAALVALLPSQPTGQPLSYDWAARKPLNDYAKDLAARRQQLLTHNPGLQSAPAVELKALQQALAPNEAALSLTGVPGNLVYSCVRHDSATLQLLPQDFSTTAADIKILQLALTAERPPDEALDTQYPVAAAVRLHRLLLAPFASCLKEGDHLLWLEPHGELPIPLTALLPSAPPKLGEGYDLSKADWVVNHYAVSYPGTAALVVANRTAAATRTIVSHAFLGVGDPDLGGQAGDGSTKQAIVARGALRGLGNDFGLEPLPETKAELEASARYFPANKILVQGSATEGSVRREVLSSYGLFSFATHGLIREEIKGLTEPALVLTPVTSANALDDGLLTASEIADLELPADFVALSACNTAHYDFSSMMTQDLPALASAFATAGVAATMGTLWAVDSTTSQTIVSGTFGRLGQDRRSGAAEALAQAQRAFLANPPRKAMLHPRFWAPFVMLGDAGARSGTTRTPSLQLDHVERVTNGGGEILATLSDGPRRYANLIGEPKDGRYAGSLRATSPGGELWRTRNWRVAAGDVLLKLGAKLLAGGNEYQADPGINHAVLELVDPNTGAARASWSGRALLPGGSQILGSALYNGKAIILLGPWTTTSASAPSALKLIEVNEQLEVKPLFDIPAAYARLSRVRMLLDAGGLLIVQTSDIEQTSTKMRRDDFDASFCLLPATTIERRDWTGRQVLAKQLPSLSVQTLAESKGALFIGGAIRSACIDQPHAVILKVDDRLETSPFFLESQLGQTAVQKIAPSADGGLVAAIQRENILGFSKPDGDVKSYILAPSGANLRFSDDVLTSGEIWVFDAKGSPVHRAELSSGSDIYLHTIDMPRKDRISVGGSIGGEAAFFDFEIAASQKDRAAVSR